MYSIRGSRDKVFAILDVVASVIALCGLLPIAGGLPSIALGGPLADGVWFTANLGGALLLLAGGLKSLAPKITDRHFLFAYATSVAVLGTLRLAVAGFSGLIPGWLFLALCIGGLLLSLPGPRLWSTVGTLWCALLLALWSVGGIMAYFSASAPEFPLVLPFQTLGCISSLVLFVLHLRYRPIADART